MPLALFGIENTALNLVVTIVILTLVAVWVALIVFTFTDARRRISDPFLVGCATVASFFPFIGTMVYTILRPPEFLEDVRERETEIRESEARLRHLEYSSCPKCSSPVESDFLRCPSCRTRLKDPCKGCARPVGLDWKVCPYCETTLIASKRARSSSRAPSSRGSKRTSSREPAKGDGRDSSGQPRASRKPRSRSKPDSEDTVRSASPGSEDTVRSEKPRATGSSRPAGTPRTGAKARSTEKPRSTGKSVSSATAAARTEVTPELEEPGTDVQGSSSRRPTRSKDGRESTRTARSSRRRVVVESDESDEGTPINRDT